MSIRSPYDQAVYDVESAALALAAKAGRTGDLSPRRLEQYRLAVARRNRLITEALDIKVAMFATREVR